MTTENKMFAEIPLNELPTWFNDQLFNDCVKSDYPNDTNLTTKIISIQPAVAPGENYASTIYRVKVKVKSKTECKIRSFIVKRLIEIILEGYDVFEKEAIMYTDILPDFVKYFDAIGEKLEFGPRIYKLFENPERVYVFEDLNERNYFVQSRHIGLDLAHTNLFYKKLAKFHAASAVYRQHHGDYDQQHFKSIYNDKSGQTIKKMIDGMFPYFLEALEKNEKLCHLTDKIKSWIPNYFSEICKLLQPNPDSFNVLCHGDTWTTNLLFSHDEHQNPNDVLLIDYQTCYWGSPAHDIFCTFTLSAQADVKENEFDNLIFVYHNELVSCLTKLNYTGKIPSLRDLHMELLRKGFLSAIWAIPLPLMTSEGGDDSKMENLVNEDNTADNFKRKMFQSTKYYKQLEALYAFLERRGQLDIK